MELKQLFPLFALATGLLSGCDPEKIEGQLQGTQDKITVSPASQKIAENGTASFTFTFSLLRPDGTVIDLTKDKTTATVHFEATGGTVSPSSGTTDENGKISVTFTASDPANFKGGTVKGTVKNVKGIVEQQGDLATATATVLPLDAEDPTVGEQPISMAEKLKENTYSIQKKGGEVQAFTLPQEYSSWYVGTSNMDSSQQAIHVELMDEDPEQMTMGWANAELPQAIANKLTTINQEFYQKYPWAGTKLGTMRLGGMIDAHMGQGGNVKLDGSSQIWLKEKSGTKSYSGDYQFLFVLVFENQEYDSETDSYVSTGEEYTICGNAIVEELVADLSDFRLDYESNWVVPGKSISISASWTPGATFDWSKVTLKSQTRNGSSGEWFSWDTSTQKLTATKSADNDQVTLTFGYVGTEMTYKISLYNGPGYSSFSLSMQNSSADYILAENDPEWGGSDTVWLTVDEWMPKESSFTGYGIEIDPDTENYNKLDYNPYGKYVSFKNGIPEGNFNLIFRSVTDHSAKFTIPVKVVHHKASSFKISYKHSNGAFEPWTSGGENGVCNYPMGMEVGVITVPEDAYWNWADVELAYDYDGFSFSGHGGKEDHPKLERTKSNPGGETGYGTQIIFRLKYDNRKTSTIYVDHN